MIVYGIDPGTYQSAIIGLDKDYKVIEKIYDDNKIIEKFIDTLDPDECVLAIEFIQSYGMSVGQNTFITIRWAGRFERAFDGNVEEYKNNVFFYARPTIKAHLCQGVRGIKDKHIRLALMTRFGGTKKGEPLEGVKSHLLSAMAVAVTHLDGSKMGAEEWMRLDSIDNRTKKKKKPKKKKGK